MITVYPHRYHKTRSKADFLFFKIPEWFQQWRKFVKLKDGNGGKLQQLPSGEVTGSTQLFCGTWRHHAVTELTEWQLQAIVVFVWFSVEEEKPFYSSSFSQLYEKITFVRTSLVFLVQSWNLLAVRLEQLSFSPLCPRDVHVSTRPSELKWCSVHQTVTWSEQQHVSYSAQNPLLLIIKKHIFVYFGSISG